MNTVIQNFLYLYLMMHFSIYLIHYSNLYFQSLTYTFCCDIFFTLTVLTLNVFCFSIYDYNVMNLYSIISKLYLHYIHQIWGQIFLVKRGYYGTPGFANKSLWYSILLLPWHTQQSVTKARQKGRHVDSKIVSDNYMVFMCI